MSELKPEAIEAKRLTTAEIAVALDKVIADPPKHFPTWPEAFAGLCQLCEDGPYSLEFRYDSGLAQDPLFNEDGVPTGEFGEPYLDEALRGFRITVGYSGFVDSDNEEAYYDKPSHAVYDGLRLVRLNIQEDLDAERLLAKHTETDGDAPRPE